MEEKKTKLLSINERIAKAEKSNDVTGSMRNEPNFKLMAEALINYYNDLGWDFNGNN
ncbi:hypothetical protein J7E63_15885 [Bacillus sp. ISL-75]|uniref:hypothetical protein n=1 Tax=Bacillus sp. ISL-75 TaxID=2819137 RepID=UPI001BECAF42|nr:hypothetical protein [Bacillus sp. ISL-75]MBT2728410.1 hypothetical protein [Bacillus sp. ISL-75]